MPTSKRIIFQEQQVYRKRPHVWMGEMDTADSHERNCPRTNSHTQADMAQLSQTPWVDCYTLLTMLCWTHNQQFHHKVCKQDVFCSNKKRRCVSIGESDTDDCHEKSCLKESSPPLADMAQSSLSQWVDCLHCSNCYVEYMYSHSTHYSNTPRHRSTPDTAMAQGNQGVEVSMRWSKSMSSIWPCMLCSCNCTTTQQNFSAVEHEAPDWSIWAYSMQSQYTYPLVLSYSCICTLYMYVVDTGMASQWNLTNTSDNVIYFLYIRVLPLITI